MKEVEFSSILIGPLHNKKVVLEEIDIDIYEEILDLSDRFLMPNQIINNLLYDKEILNPLIEGLKKQSNISNLKTLINQKESLKIAKIFNESSIDYVFLKGAAINLMNDDYIRHSRDIDILVTKECLSESYELLKKIGYKYLNPLVSDCSSFTKQSHHLPILSNQHGGIVELHHRITEVEIYKDCPLKTSMLHGSKIVKKNGIDIKVCDLSHLIAHITYHAALHHQYDFGPLFFYDIRYLKEMVKDKSDLKRLLSNLNLRDEYKKIEVYIDSKNTLDAFGIYEKSNNRKKLKTNPKRFSQLIFTKEGRYDFYKIILRKLTKNEDYYQTSKFSVKFYFILLVELKDHILRLLKD
tara:strand:- start:39 stop:1097 length:1059 start_codon:yes stop_codon:yes gene_type:complete